MKYRLTDMSSLNDPFDCFPEYADEVEFPPQFRRYAATTVFQDRKSKFGLICLSRTWSHHLLWGHYADKHRGMALVFSYPKRKDLLNIDYRKTHGFDSLRSIRTGGHSKGTQLYASVTTKALAWRYERETRFILPVSSTVQKGKHRYVPLDSNAFRGVVLGIRCEFSTRKLRQILDRKRLANATIWRVRKEPGIYTLLREKITRDEDTD